MIENHIHHPLLFFAKVITDEIVLSISKRNTVPKQKSRYNSDFNGYMFLSLDSATLVAPPAHPSYLFPSRGQELFLTAAAYKNI
ncbi:hypothetical protein ACX12E_20985 [Paenibacillus vandeheii]